MISRSPSSESIVSSTSPRIESTGNIQQAAADPKHSLNSLLPQISTIPSAMPSWETSPQSPSSDKQRPFKSKSKHNLAVFGAKLTSTAASVGAHASKYKQKEKDALKESNRESLFMDELEVLPHSHDSAASIIGNQSPNSVSTVPVTVGGSNGGGSGGMLKSKMFKQSKSDLKSLRIKTDLGIQAARSTLNDRSPMVRGGSTKELDRIAAIGQVGSITQPNDSITGGNAHHHHLHHPHISFRKRDSPAAVLSSSASNSILASEGTVYSFNQSNNNGPPSALASLHSFKTVEEGTAFLTSSWTLLNLRIQSLFKRDEALRIPVEDVNILVLMHFSAHYALAGTGLEILKRLDELLETGLKSSSIIPKQSTLKSLADSWQYFFSNTLISLEAIFLPLQLEFDAVGQVFTSSQAARDYWFPLAASRPSTSSRTLAAGRSKTPRISMRRKILTVYRDVAVVPHLAKLAKQIEDIDSPNSTCSAETMAQTLQCLTTLSQLHSEGEAQKSIESNLLLIQEGLMRKRKLQGEPKGASGSRRV